MFRNILLDVMQEEGYSQDTLAVAMGVSQSSVSHVLQRCREPGMKLVRGFLRAFPARRQEVLDLLFPGSPAEREELQGDHALRGRGPAEDPQGEDPQGEDPQEEFERVFPGRGSGDLLPGPDRPAERVKPQGDHALRGRGG